MIQTSFLDEWSSVDQSSEFMTLNGSSTKDGDPWREHNGGNTVEGKGSKRAEDLIQMLGERRNESIISIGYGKQCALVWCGCVLMKGGGHVFEKGWVRLMEEAWLL